MGTLLKVTNPVDKMEITSDGSIQVREATVITNDGVVDTTFAPQYHRYVVHPGDDLSGRDARLVALANVAWTADVVAAYQAAVTNSGGVQTNARVVPEEISDVQFYAQLAIMGEITWDEAKATATGAIPQRLVTAIGQLPADQQNIATLKIAGNTVFLRHSPLTAALGTLLNKTSDEIDAIWIAAQAI